MTGPGPRESWRRLRAPDADSLRAFLLRHEDQAAGFSGRVLRAEGLHIPGPLEGGVFGSFEPGGLRAAVLWTRSGTVFPVFDDTPDRGEAEALGRIFKGGSVDSFLGAEADVEALECILRAEPRVRTPYRSMYLDPNPMAPPCPPPSPGAEARIVGPGDTAALFPLHSAYEREEVVTVIHRFDARASRAALDKILESEVVAVAELDGRAVATARTNARGFRTWQIGGVFVVPELRGRGWGRFVMNFLVGVLIQSGKAAGLFVKERNIPARTLYLSMGFRDVGPFRVDYL